MGKDLLNYLKGNLTGSSTKYEEVPEEYYKTPSIFGEPRQEALMGEIDPSGKGLTTLYRRGRKGGRWWSTDREYANIWDDGVRPLQKQEVDLSELNILDTRKGDHGWMKNKSEEQIDKELVERGYDGFIVGGERGEPIYRMLPKKFK